MSDAPEPATYYTETLPEQWNRALREQERRAEAEQRVLEGMRSVEATLCMQVDDETFYLNVSQGRATAGDAAAHPPLLSLIQERADFQRLVSEAGDSALGFLGALSGVGGEMRLTRARLEALRGVAGSLRFEVSGEAGFALLARFGGAGAEQGPSASIRVGAEVYAQLRAGQLDAQNAFLSGGIEVEGDMQLAMQIALAAMAPD